MLAEGVLSGGRAPRVLAAVSQHALIAAATAAVVEQGRLAHGRGKLSAQDAAVEGKTRLLKVKPKRKTLSTKQKIFTLNVSIFLRELQLLPVVARMAAAAAVWLSGGCDLAVGRGQRLDRRRPLVSSARSSATR